MKKKRISVTSAKAKGRNLQKWAAQKIADLTGFEFKEEDDALISSRPMGQHGTDVILRGEALKSFPFSIECKSSQQWSLPAAIKQSKQNTKKNTDWMLILKRKEIKTPVVVIDANTFFDIVDVNKLKDRNKEV